MTPKPYAYNAIVTKVYDGDTITVDIDLGLGVWLKKQTIRLYGINTPELRGDEREEGLESRAELIELLQFKGGPLTTKPCHVTIKTYKVKKGKYGSWLAEVYAVDESNSSIFCVNDMLVRNGYAERKEY